ncbi:hypothetical protein [Ralstonia wenshanensis]|nr:hypothetical protein [Ralstonia wenshanensis]
MLNMFARATIACVVFLAAPVSAEQYDFGGVSIEVPSPPGYTAVPNRAAMEEMSQLVKGTVTYLEYFEPKHHGQPLQSWMLLQTLTRVRYLTASKQDFAQFKAKTRAMDFQKAVEQRFPGMLQSVGISAAKIMGVNEDTDEWFMYSTAIGSPTGQGKNDEPAVMVASYLLIKGKLVTLTTYRMFKGADDVTKAQQEARLWALAVLNANR